MTHYHLAPETDTWLGYRFFDLQGSRKAAEYEYPYSSVVGGLKMLYVPLPERWEADLDWVNPNSWTADASLGYRDILKIDYTGWALWRNYNHFGLIGIVPPDDKDPGGQYFTDDQDNRLSLILKWPDRPYHVFINLRQFEKDGTVQARFYEGTKRERVPLQGYRLDNQRPYRRDQRPFRPRRGRIQPYGQDLRAARSGRAGGYDERRPASPQRGARVRREPGLGESPYRLYRKDLRRRAVHKRRARKSSIRRRK